MILPYITRKSKNFKLKRGKSGRLKLLKRQPGYKSATGYGHLARCSDSQAEIIADRCPPFLTEETPKLGQIQWENDND